MSEYKKVLATHEEPQTLSTGVWLGDNFPGVALPCEGALRRWVLIRYGNRFTCAMVMDVGPWAEDDQEYVFGNERPRAEAFKGAACPLRRGGELGHLECNGAGIDLFPATARALGIPEEENVLVEWKFIDPSSVT